MHAYLLKKIGELKYENISIPDCPSGWAIVKVKATGICSSDIPRIFKKGTYHFPLIPGHEFSGIIEQVADKDNTNLVGKRVGVFPLIPCKKCIQCKRAHYEMCIKYDYIGSRRDGSFAEYVAVPIWNIIELNESVSFEAAAMMEPLAVALHAVKQSGLQKGDTIGFFGTGMIGFAAAQWAKRKDAAEVVVIGRSNDKKKIADNIPGIKYLLASEIQEEFDIIIEAVGSNESIINAIKATKPGGTLVLMGNPDGNISLPQDIYWRILRKQLKLIGTWNSVYERNGKSDWTEVKEALISHTLEPESLISHRFDQQHLPLGLELMLKHRESYCKVMTLWNN